MSNDIINLFNSYDVFYGLKFLLDSIIFVCCVILLYLDILYCLKEIKECIKLYKSNKIKISNIYLGKNINKKSKINKIKILKLFLCSIYFIFFISYSFYYLNKDIDKESFKDKKIFVEEVNKLIINNNLVEKEIDFKSILNLKSNNYFIKYISLNEIRDNENNILIDLSNKEKFNETDFKELIGILKENNKLTLKLKIDYLVNNNYKSKDIKLNLLLSDKILKYPEFTISTISYDLSKEDDSNLKNELSKIKYNYILNVLEDCKTDSIYPLKNIILNENLLLKLIKEDNIELNYKS